MAYYFLFPELDTTLYSHPDRSEMNAGSDEILEIVKERGSTDNILYPSRIILKFKNDDLIDTIGNIVGHNNFNNITTASLQLTAAEPKNLISTLNLELFALSQSWDEGTGRFSNLPTSSNGCSWLYRDNDIDKTLWVSSSIGPGGIVTGSIADNTTASFGNKQNVTEGGGAWYTGSAFQGSQQFLNSDSLDTNINVTSIVQKHSASLFSNSTYPTGIFNNGFIIKQPDSIEQDTSSSFGEMKYFSVDTPTIYPQN